MKKETMTLITAAVVILLLLMAVGMVLMSCSDGSTEPTQTVEPSFSGTESTDGDTPDPQPAQTEQEREPGVYFVKILPTAHGSVTANLYEAREGEQIVLTVTPEEGYKLQSLTVNGVKTDSKFQMPAEDVDVVARFSLIAEEKESGSSAANGDFFGTAGRFQSSDQINMGTDKGKNPSLVLDAQKATPLFAYVKNLSAKQFYFETQVQVTDIRKGENYPKFGLLTNDGTEMVKFYLDMNTDWQASVVGAVHQPEGQEDDWAGQTTWNLMDGLNLQEDQVTLGLLRNGNEYYLYVNGKLAAAGSDLSGENAATGVFSFGTSLKLTKYFLENSGSAFDARLAKARADAEEFRKPILSENYFTKKSAGVYTLTTNSDAQHLVDDVMTAGSAMRETYYSLKGKLTLTDAQDWGQARILISADPKNEYFIALEQTGAGQYQIFTMSKADEEGWNDWRLIESAALNGGRNSLDFEVVLIGDRMYFLLDDEICYESTRVPLTESTVKFTGYNKATTTVENLSLEVFADKAAAEAYVAGKNEKTYVSQYQERMDALYTEYITEHGCAGKGGTLIFGDSNMDFWGAWEEQSGLTKYVNGYNVGIGGSTTKDWLHAYDKLIKPFGADRFVILVGGNDVNVWGDSGEEAVARLETLFTKLHADHPNAEIYYIYTTPSPSAYANGAYVPAKLGALVSGAKSLCDGLDYVQGINVFDLMVTADKQNSNTKLFASDGVHMSEDGYKVFSDYLYEKIFRGETFGAAGSYKTSNGIELAKDKGKDATMDVFGGAPRYAYLHNVFTDKFCFETRINVKAVLNGDAYPKFGLMVNGSSEMVKFFVDMTAQMTASHAGVVYQPTGGGDDWGGSVSSAVPGMSFTGSDTVKLKLVRDGSAYYFYVNDELILYDENGFKAEQGAVGIFSFNSVLTASDYSVAVGANANAAIQSAKDDLKALSKVTLTTNFFKETTDGVYTLTTDSDAEYKVDDVKLGRDVLRTAYYSVKGKLALTNAGDWGQARILVSADGQNEYFFALERTAAGKFQFFTMSKANQTGWDQWELILSENDNGTRSSINFEVVVIGNKLYFLIDDVVIYISSRVPMAESTVKFTGYNVGTTTVNNLSAEVFSDSNAAAAYINGKDTLIGETFGISNVIYRTTNGVSLANDKGTDPSIKVTGGAPQYAYVHNLFTDKFCVESRFNVEAVLNGDAYPKFGLMVNGSSEMVKFFVDMTAQMTASHAGVVYQPTGGGDDWGGSVSSAVPGMSFTGSDTVKLKLVRDGRAYYFYVNDELILYDENGFKAEQGAVGIFSFNAALTASNYTVLSGSAADSAIQSAKSTVAYQTRIGLTNNYFTDNGNGAFTLTTDSNAEHKVDDLTRGGSVLRTAYYSVKGKLTLTNAGDWGQARILVSADGQNEYFFALERTAGGKFQFFTMSKANQSGWDVWQLILNENDNGTRNSIDFEVVVIGNKLHFLIDNAVVYTSDRVPMTESTVKFTGYNVGTTTVENLSAVVFKNQQEAEAYLAEKTA